MGRRKKRKLPGLPKADNAAVMNIIGLIVFLAGCISLISFFIFFINEDEGRMLFLINQLL